MLTITMINGRWEAYEKKKKMTKQDINIFCPEELWEFNYLLDTIVEVAPSLDPIRVMLAIRQGIRDTVAPRPRHSFVQRVINSIEERETQFAQILESNNRQDAA